MGIGSRNWSTSSTLYELDSTNGKLLRSIDIPFLGAHDLSFAKDGNIWLLDSDSGFVNLIVPAGYLIQSYFVGRDAELTSQCCPMIGFAIGGSNSVEILDPINGVESFFFPWGQSLVWPRMASTESLRLTALASLTPTTCPATCNK